MIKLQGRSQIMNHDEELCVFRDQKIRYVDGKPVRSPPIEFKIICNVQPMTGRDLLLVPEGDRFKEQYFIYSEDITKALEINDRVVFRCNNYQVQETMTWGSYTRSRIMKIDVGPNASAESTN